MSRSIEEHIGEGRPWPEQVVVYRGETDESLTYARRSLSDVNKMVELMDTLAAENAKLREGLVDAPKCESCEAMLDCDECLRADGSHKERRRLSYENEKLRELVCDLYEAYEGEVNDCWLVEFRERMHELGVDA